MGGALCLFSVRLQSPSCWSMESSGNRCYGPVWVEVRCKNVLFCQMESSPTSYRCGGITTFHCEILVESWLPVPLLQPVEVANSNLHRVLLHQSRHTQGYRGAKREMHLPGRTGSQVGLWILSDSLRRVRIRLQTTLGGSMLGLIGTAVPGPSVRWSGGRAKIIGLRRGWSELRYSRV